MSVFNGGPAFPFVHEVEPGPGFDRAIKIVSGMTLRDWFAGRWITGYNPGRLLTDGDVAMLAALAYRMADAMIAERAK